jgi:hypothetical protein
MFEAILTISLASSRKELEWRWFYDSRSVTDMILRTRAEASESGKKVSVRPVTRFVLEDVLIKANKFVYAYKVTKIVVQRSKSR